MTDATGGCLCGAVRFTATGPPTRVGLCLCLECRKHHGAMFYAAAVFPADRFSRTGDTRAYKGRAFCPVCGSSVYAESVGEVEVHLGALDDPNAFTPSYELWTCRRAPWMPRFEGVQSFETDRTNAGKLD